MEFHSSVAPMEQPIKQQKQLTNAPMGQPIKQ